MSSQLAQIDAHLHLEVCIGSVGGKLKRILWRKRWHGEGYAKAVCAILASLENPPNVQIVRLYEVNLAIIGKDN